MAYYNIRNSSEVYDVRAVAVLSCSPKIWPDDVLPWIIHRMRPLLGEFIALPQHTRLGVLEMLVHESGLSACSQNAAAADVILNRIHEDGTESRELTSHERRCALINIANVTGVPEPWRVALRLNEMLGKEDPEFVHILTSTRSSR